MASTISAGTTTTTALVYSADTSGVLQLQTNGGTTALTLDTSQNVGIGTTSPATTLHLNGATSGAAKLRVGRSTSDTNFIQLQMNGGDSVIQANGVTGTSGSLAFWRDSNTGSPVESARFDSSGNLLVGTTSQIAAGRVGVSYNGSTLQGIALNDTAGNSSAQPLRFLSNGTAVGAIITSTTNTSYNTSSDYRLKNTISPMIGALAKVAELKPCTYKWNVDGSDGQGFIAHELQAVFSDAVHGEKDGVDAEGNPVYQGIDTSFLVATLTAAIQEQQAMITTLQSQVTALKG